MRLPKTQHLALVASLILSLVALPTSRGRAEERPPSALGASPNLMPQTLAQVHPDPAPGAQVSVEVVEDDGRRRVVRRSPWLRPLLLVTLATAGLSLVTGAVLGGVALGQKQTFESARADNSLNRMELESLAQRTRLLAFTSDVFFGASALLGSIVLVLRFGSGGGVQQAPPENLERAYDIPGGAR